MICVYNYFLPFSPSAYVKAVGLRSFLGELGCIAVSASVPIPRAWKAFNDDGGLAAENQVKALDSMLDQLEWHATAMKNHRSDRGSDRT